MLVISIFLELINAKKMWEILIRYLEIHGLFYGGFSLPLLYTVLYRTVHSGPVGKMQGSLTSKQMVRLAQSVEHRRPHRSANPSAFQEVLLLVRNR